MPAQSLALIFERDLLKLKDELNNYPTEAGIWLVKPGIGNSAGNLCLHLVGNLNHFIGAGLGNTGYVRNRTAEFELKDVPRQQLLADIDSTRAMLKQVLQNLPAEILDKEFPMELPMGKFTTQQFLLHLLTHLSYHLGQINYHRRLLAGQ
jgi:uncharacterized damage-inducible protein DinB